MILVLLGTQNNSFHRLLEEIQKNIENGKITEEVVVQKGYTKFQSKYMELFNELPIEEFKEKIEIADIVISHGGVGSIIESITRGKKVIAVPRLQKYKEHVNNHQIDIIEAFNEKGYIIGIHNVEELGEALEKIKSFTPERYVKNNGKIIKLVSDFIDNN